MGVFDDIERHDPSPARHGETHAEFLNRVHTRYWQAVRDLIEDWFSHLPPDEQPDTRARLRSSDNRAYYGAFWELYLHESLRRGGYTVSCHPHIEGTRRRPDFLAERAGYSFYLEARNASEADDEITAATRRNRVYDALNNLDSPNFFLWIDVETEGTADLPMRVLGRRLEEWLSQLDPDYIGQLLSETNSIRSAPSYEWHHEDWHLVFRPVPKKRDARGKKGARLVGVFGPGPGSSIDDVSPLKKALIDKGSAYGELGLPYVIAIRTSPVTADDLDVLNALYGTLQVQFGTTPSGETVTREVRAADGYWFGGHEWRHTNVSAALIGKNLHPWTVSWNVPTLWMHPAPSKPLNPPPFWDQSVARDGQPARVDASVSPSELLGLARDWPGGRPVRRRPATWRGGLSSLGGAYAIGRIVQN